MSTSTYQGGSWPGATAYSAPYQQQAVNPTEYDTPEYAAYYAYWNTPAGVAAREGYDTSQNAQTVQQYPAASPTIVHFAPPLPADNPASHSTPHGGHHAPAGPSAHLIKPEPSVPGLQPVGAATETSQPPLPKSEPSDPTHPPMPSPQQGTAYPAYQYGPTTGAATTPAGYGHYSAAQLGVPPAQQQYAQQAAWSTLTPDQQQQQYADYYHYQAMQQAVYAPQQHQPAQYQHQPAHYNQAMGFVPAQGGAPHHIAPNPPPTYPVWSAPANPHPQQQQNPSYNLPFNVPPSPASVPPPSGIVIRPQWGAKPPAPVASHQSMFPTPSVPTPSVPTPQYRPTAYTQVTAAKPPTPFQGLNAASYANIHTQRVPLPAPQTPTPPIILPAPAKPPPIVPGPQPPQTGMGKYPPTFPPYVERCFARCKLDNDRALMTVRLQRKIQDVETAGRLWAVQWDTEPVPGLGPEPPATGTAAAAGSPVAMGQTKRGRWGAEVEHNSPSPARSRFGDVRGEAADNKAGRKTGYGAAPDGHSHQYEAPHYVLSKRQKKAAMAAERARASFIPSAHAASPGLARLNPAAAAEHDRRQQRTGRFKDGHAIAGGGVIRSRRTPGLSSSSDDDSDSDIDLTDVAIKGTCQDLEKSYFRLTAAPDPYQVRPESVLKLAYARLQTALASGNAGYFYACDQLKGMRQDLTVQRIRSPLAVLIYEMHARSALEYGDFAEFNQCQTQLHTILYTDGGTGGCRGEFHAYMLLYQSVHARLGLNKALLHSMQAVTPELASTQAVSHALQVRQAMMQENYASFFRLYRTASGLGRAIMDVAVPKIRWAALNTLVKVYKTSLPVSLFAEVLGFVPAPPQAAAAPARAATVAAANAAATSSATAASPSPTPDTLQDTLTPTPASPTPVSCGLHDSEMEESSPASPPKCLHDSQVPSTANIPPGLETPHDSEMTPASADPVLNSLQKRDGSPEACTAPGLDSMQVSMEREATPQELALCSERVVCDVVPDEVLLPGCTRVGYAGRFAAGVSVVEGMAACVLWLTSHGAVLDTAVSPEPMVNVKVSVGQLKVPTEVSKVAHGDENLSLDDFLNRASMASAAR